MIWARPRPFPSASDHQRVDVFVVAPQRNPCARTLRDLVERRDNLLAFIVCQIERVPSRARLGTPRRVRSRLSKSSEPEKRPKISEGPVSNRPPQFHLPYALSLRHMSPSAHAGLLGLIEHNDCFDSITSRDRFTPCRKAMHKHWPRVGVSSSHSPGTRGSRIAHRRLGFHQCLPNVGVDRVPPSRDQRIVRQRIDPPELFASPAPRRDSGFGR